MWGKCPASSGPQPSNLCNGAGEHWQFSGKSPKRCVLSPCVLALSWGDVGWEGPGWSHTHGAGLIPKKVDGVKAVLVQAVQAVALVPALREDVKADHAPCGGAVNDLSAYRVPGTDLGSSWELRSRGVNRR